MIMHECGRRTRQLCSNASLTARGVVRRFSQCSCVPSFLHAPTSVSPRGRMASHIPSFCRCALLARRRAHMQHAAMPPRRAPARRCVLRALTRRARTTSSCHGLRFERGGDGEGGVQTRKMLLVCDWARGARRAGRARHIGVEGVSSVGVKNCMDFRRIKWVIYPATSVTLARSIFGIRCAQQRSAVPSCSARGGNLEDEGYKMDVLPPCRNVA